MKQAPCQNEECECYDPRRSDHCEIGPVILCPFYKPEPEEYTTQPNYKRYGY